MCGICGSVSLSQLSEPEVARQRVQAMLLSLAHRGPDDANIVASNSAVLGVTRLAIRGLADANQPIVDADSGVIAVCNGEIDNHRQLRQWLAERGRPVHRTTDVAVIPALYLELGEKFAEKLTGAFAIAIWDPRQSRLILARDRAGERPLFYTTHAGEIIFATELAALTAQKRLPVELNLLALKKYLQFGIFPAPAAPFDQIQKVAPGELITMDAAGVRRQFYWRWRVVDNVGASSSLDDFDVAFRTAVARQTDVEVDFGVFLSGGVDSSLVSAVARSLHPHRAIKAYTLRFREDSFDEGQFAEEAARHLNLELTNVWVRPEEVPETLKSLVRLVGEPLADPAWIPAALLSRQAARDVKMALVGEGADELFGGYPTYIGAGLASHVARWPGWARRLLHRAVNALPPSDKKVTLSFLLKRFVSGLDLNGLERHQCWISNIPPELFRRLTGESIEFVASGIENHRLLDQLQQWDLENMLAEGLLTKADRSSMSSSLELRAPFLDADVMAFAAGLLPADRVKRFQTKVLLKQYALRYLPKNVVYRRKRGLSVPVGTWLRGPLRDWAEGTLGSGHLERAGVRTPVALELFHEHVTGRANHSRALWTLLVLVEWLYWTARETTCGNGVKPFPQVESLAL